MLLEEREVERLERLEVPVAGRPARRLLAVHVVVVERDADGVHAVDLELHVQPLDERGLARRRRTRDRDDPDPIARGRDLVGELPDPLLVEPLRDADELGHLPRDAQLVERADARHPHRGEPALVLRRHVRAGPRVRPRRGGHVGYAVPRVHLAELQREPAVARREPEPVQAPGGGEERAHRERVHLAARHEPHRRLPADAQQPGRVVPAPVEEPPLRLVGGPELEPDRQVERGELPHRLRDALGERREVADPDARHVHDLVRPAGRPHADAKPRRDLVGRLEQDEPERVGVDLPPLPVAHRQRRDLRLRRDRGREGDRLLPEQPRDDDRAVHLGGQQVDEPGPGADAALLARDGHDEVPGAWQGAAPEQEPHVAGEVRDLVRERGRDPRRDLHRERRVAALERGPRLGREPRDPERPVRRDRLAAVPPTEQRELAERVSRAEAAERELRPPERRGAREHDVEVLPGVAVAVHARLRRDLAHVQGAHEARALGVVEAREQRAVRERGQGLPGLLRPFGQHASLSVSRAAGRCP